MDPNRQKRQEAIRALINIALMEGAVLIIVVLIYLQTENITYLVGGVVASSIIFAPLFYRWFRAHGPALKPAAEKTRDE
ncbi:hypothetical protein [Hyphococcus sp.]|uniref:hypothetical protein n=1 Tax=Hyphococcus sp. TaxID=2038636 RepID=UPI003CCBA2AC